MGRAFQNGLFGMVLRHTMFQTLRFRMVVCRTTSPFQPMEAGVSRLYPLWQEFTDIVAVGGMMTGEAASSGLGADFTLTITALLPCNKPVASVCGSNSNPAFDVSQWKAWSVDDFLATYYTNYTKGAFGSTGSFMNTFYNDFTDGEGSAYDQCNVTDSPINNCNWIGNCHNLATGAMSELTPYEVPAYLTMYAMRSKYLVISPKPRSLIGFEISWPFSTIFTSHCNGQTPTWNVYI